MRFRACQLATVCIPWGTDGDFLEDTFRRQVRLLREAGFKNLYIFGTAGEGYAITDSLFQHIAEVFHDSMKATSGLCQLGVIGMSTAQIRSRIDCGIKIGFRDFQISLPPWGTVNNQEMMRFFDDVLSPYPDMRFLHYNIARSGRVLTGEDYARLAERHPNLVATKSGGHKSSALLALHQKAPSLCHFLTEFDFATARLLGLDCGLLVSISAVNPHRCHELYQSGINKDVSKVLCLLGELNRVREQLIHLVNIEGAHMDGAYDKVYARLADPEFPLHLLSPYSGISAATFESFKDWLSTEASNWGAA